MTESGSVWVIEDGEYSDYRVLGVYSSESNANKVSELLGGQVSEWPLNPEMDHINAGRRPYLLSMSATGTVTWCKPIDYEPAGLFVNRNGNVSGSMWATDEAHATKIANEFRILARAEGEI